MLIREARRGPQGLDDQPVPNVLNTGRAGETACATKLRQKFPKRFRQHFCPGLLNAEVVGAPNFDRRFDLFLVQPSECLLRKRRKFGIGGKP